MNEIFKYQFVFEQIDHPDNKVVFVGTSNDSIVKLYQSMREAFAYPLEYEIVEVHFSLINPTESQNETKKT